MNRPASGDALLALLGPPWLARCPSKCVKAPVCPPLDGRSLCGGVLRGWLGVRLGEPLAESSGVRIGNSPEGRCARVAGEENCERRPGSGGIVRLTAGLNDAARPYQEVDGMPTFSVLLASEARSQRA